MFESTGREELLKTNRSEEIIDRGFYAVGNIAKQKYYVGQSLYKNLNIRIAQELGHKIGLCKPSLFCQIYKPDYLLYKFVLQCTYKEGEKIEDILTYSLGEQFGHENVMGGSLCHDMTIIKKLKKKIND